MIFFLCRAVDIFYLLSVDTSWRAAWHYRPLDRCQSGSVWADSHSRSVHLPFWKKILRPSSYIFHQSSLFVPISRRLRSSELSTVNFTNSWDFVVATVFRMVGLVVFWRLKATLLKFFSNWTRGFVLGKKYSFRISTSGIFWIDFASGFVSGGFVGQELLASPLILGLSLFFSIIIFLCLVFFMGSVPRRWCGWVFSLLLGLH